MWQATWRSDICPVPRVPDPLPRFQPHCSLEKSFISPLVLSFQIWESSTPGCSSTLDRMSHNSRNSTMARTESTPCTSEIQVWFVRSSRTVYLFALILGMRAMKCGARSAMHCPWSHLSFQNRVHALSPTSEMTTIEKKAPLTQWCTWIGNSSIPPMDYLAWFFFQPEPLHSWQA